MMTQGRFITYQNLIICIWKWLEAFLEVAIKGRGNIYLIPVGGRKCKECGGICRVDGI